MKRIKFWTIISRRKNGIISLILMLSMSLSIITVFGNKVSAVTDTNYEQSNSMCASDISFLYASFEKTVFEIDENISFECKVNKEYLSIVSYSYITSNVDVISEINNGSGIAFVLTVDKTIDLATIQINAILSDGDEVGITVFVLNTAYGIFTSTSSESDLRREYYHYLENNNIIDSLTAESEINRISLSGFDVVENDIDNFILETSPIEGDAELTATTDTSISITFNWTGNNNISHPIYGMKVEMYDYDNSLSSTKIATKYTNSNGVVRFNFENADDFLDFENGGYDIYFKLYAQDSGNIIIKDEVGKVQSASTLASTNQNNSLANEIFYENITTGSNISLTHYINMDNAFGQSIQIFQAMTYARNYTEVIFENTPNPVSVIYPFYSADLADEARCYYHNNVIRIWQADSAFTFQTYESWDMLMHEYGHHVQNQLEIYNSVSVDSHSIRVNHIDSIGKQNGIRLAWYEAWPTVFGLMAQSYYGSYVSGIPYVWDTSYMAYNFTSEVEIEECKLALGEGCELSICAVLWDLFDNGTELYDNISLGHVDYWYITTNGKPLTFNEFAGDFFDEYYTSTDPTMILDWGSNLTEFQFAPKALRSYCYGGTSASDPVTIRWYAQGGSSVAPNNEFALAFYDQYYDEIYFITDITGESYTLDAYDWEYILDSCGSKYYVSVVGYQTSTPSTGWYFSRPISFDAP